MAKRLRDEPVSHETSDDAVNSTPPSSDEHEAHTPKYMTVEPEEVTIMRCLLEPHRPLSFFSYAEYEAHYQQAHTNRCSECKKNFPTGHFLELHIAEDHDPIVASKRDAGEKTHACFVEGCEKVCSDWKKRRSHLVDKHGYPKNYDFLVVDYGIDGRRSMLRPGIDAQGHRKSSRERGRSDSSISANTQTTEATSTSSQNVVGSAESKDREKSTLEPSQTNPAAKENGKDVDDLTSSLSAMKMVPRSVIFGHRKGRSGFARR